jgi:hypothetical protein
MRHSAFAESSAMHFPPSSAAWKRHPKRPAALARKAICKSQLDGAAANDALGRLRKQSLAGSIHQPELLIQVEGKDGNFDLGHYGSQQRRSFKSAEALLAKNLTQEINLEHRFAERIVVGGASRPDRKIALPKRRKQVRKSLKREYNSLADCVREAKPETDDHHRERPFHLVRVRALPKQN